MLYGPLGYRWPVSGFGVRSRRGRIAGTPGNAITRARLPAAARAAVPVEVYVISDPAAQLRPVRR